MSFTELGLSAAILKAVAEQGYDTPSPIQAKAIPAVLAGRDVMAAAQTGTGKTAGFTLPILELLTKGQRAQGNQVRTLILTPTRELAAQVADSVATYSKHLPLSSTVVFGGVKINPQMLKLRHGVDVLVATPGRLLDLYNQNAVRFKQLEILVLDEADRMLDMGFLRDIRKILALLPKQRQNLMFSATFSDDIRNLAKGLINSPVEVSVSPANSTTEMVEQFIYPVDKAKKNALLAHIIKAEKWTQVLVFSRTKHGANKITKMLVAKGINAAAIHGNKSQGARTKALAEFKAGAIQVLVATDIAARGIDIDQLPHVVNFDLPHVSEDYVHRIGRTGRAGASGTAVSLVSEDEVKLLFPIERLIKQLITRVEVAGFEPINKVPKSKLDTRPFKAKKPKKEKSLQSANSQSSTDQPAKNNQGKVEHKDGQRSGDNAKGHQLANNSSKSKKPNKVKQRPKKSNSRAKNPYANSP
jgi:ATP-dependent RNA helicase RhlE